MRKRSMQMMIGSIALVVVLLALTLLLGRSPKLGLDLQGGVAVNLQPVKNGKVDNTVSDDRLDQAIEIIRRRVDALGVSEPEVSRQGNTVSVQLPGAKDQAEVLKVVGSTAQLEFRPVIQAVGQIPTGADRTKAEKQVKKLRADLNVPEGVTAQQIVEDEQAKQTAAAPGDLTPVPDGTTDTTAPADATPNSTPADEAPTTTEKQPAKSGGGRSAAISRPTAQADPPPPVSDPNPAATADGTPSEATTPGAPTTTVPPTPLNQYGVDVYDKSFTELYQLESQLNTELTPPDEMKHDEEVTLATEDGVVYKLGPVAVDGKAVKDANAGLSTNGQWTVNPVFRSGEENIDQFNAIAARCYAGSAECPDVGGGKGQLGIVLDGVILSAPTINTPSFGASEIQISGSFNKESAEKLAVALRYGSLPFQLKPQQAENVSATLGKGALQAGIICGLIGLVLVLLYLTLYYRMLGVITAIGTAMLGTMLWVVMANLNAAVTLAGVVGLVVAIGTSLDSNIIFFEVLKEDVINGTPLKSASEKSFSAAWSTILASDISSLIGAGVLYWLAIGPVRGFAFYLGAATILDLVVVFFFLRPAVYLMAHSKLGQNPSLFGIPTAREGEDQPIVQGSRRRRVAKLRPESQVVSSTSATIGEDS